ncbi:hypothetical protein KOW79_011927 [Hemibagrus wyckioides]|uniref:Uncharacterized protein n=1 Tax=Hemibagrus wyckioides TaxID=337641 RepID=A0A9D3NJS4_9TELE|nr:hypothetical protein KOW79_011927 [Hemibagrus wyckioides]
MQVFSGILHCDPLQCLITPALTVVLHREKKRARTRPPAKENISSTIPDGLTCGVRVAQQDCDPVCEQATEPVLLPVTKIPQDQMTASLSEAEETITQLEEEKFNLTDQEYERDQEAHRLLKSEYEEMIETLKISGKLLKDWSSGSPPGHMKLDYGLELR